MPTISHVDLLSLQADSNTNDVKPSQAFWKMQCRFRAGGNSKGHNARNTIGVTEWVPELALGVTQYLRNNLGKHSRRLRPLVLCTT